MKRRSWKCADQPGKESIVKERWNQLRLQEKARESLHVHDLWMELDSCSVVVLDLYWLCY